jgi:hypothetical protein
VHDLDWLVRQFLQCLGGSVVNLINFGVFFCKLDRNYEIDSCGLDAFVLCPRLCFDSINPFSSHLAQKSTQIQSEQKIS